MLIGTQENETHPAPHSPTKPPPRQFLVEQQSDSTLAVHPQKGSSKYTQVSHIIIIIIIYPLTARIVGAPHDFTTSFLHFPCSPLPSGTWKTPELSIPRCCLPASPSVCLVFFPLSLCLARRFWPNLMNGRHDHTTAVCVSLRSSGDLRVVQVPAGSWHGLPRW